MKKILYVFIILLVITGCTANYDQPNRYKVTRVVDGDTIQVKIDDKTEKVRLIGVDTPETVKPNTPVQHFGKEASNYTKKLLLGKHVLLEFDTQERDRYGRLLAYVYLDDGTMVNQILVENGYAKVMTIPPNVKYVEEFTTAQKKARENNMGLWKNK